MKLQQLLSYTRKAVDDYQMIQEGDHIAVGISGGEDSLTLLYALHGLKRFYPHKFELSAITVDLGYEKFDTEPLKRLCDELEVPYRVVKTDIAHILFEERKESNPCSLCAKLRRGALHNNAKELGCNKVALGHHKDDAIETLMLAISYEGRINCFSPKTFMDKENITLIRPMVYIAEESIKRVVKKYDFPVIHNPCPADKKTRREDMKNLIYELNHRMPGFKDNLFGALTNSEQLFIWDKEEIKNQ